MNTVVLILAGLYALNMGGANFGVSFAAAYGGRILSRHKAQFLFSLFVILGATFLGKNVANTLGERIILQRFLSPEALLIVFFGAGLSLVVSNILRIPQSTSLVTVAALAGVGISLGGVQWAIIFTLAPFWILLPLVSFVLTLLGVRLIYPPRRINFWLYEKLINHQQKLKAFVIVSSCYNAFSIGSNNVANAIGPIYESFGIPLVFGLVAFSAVFGMGAFMAGGSLKSAGEQIVPLGPMTSSLICLICGSLMLTASFFGVPQSFVMMKVAALLAVSFQKNGFRQTIQKRTTKQMFFSWGITPAFTLLVCYTLSNIFLR